MEYNHIHSNPLLVRFHAYLEALVTIEKRQISALTDLAKTIQTMHPELVPAVCQIIIDRAQRSSADVQLPTLYLLDCISKNLGEPFVSGFSDSLAIVFDHAWVVGAPGLHGKLRKLAVSWKPVFPANVMKMIDVCMHPSKAPAPGIGDSKNKPMMRDPRLAHVSASDDLQQQQQPDILNLLANTGDLSTLLGVQVPSEYRLLTTEMIKEKNNQAAIDRLQASTAAYKSKFLDNKFLKRKLREGHAQNSQMWYLDLDTWYRGTMTSAGNDAVGPADASDAPATLPASLASVPADDHQTSCAVSGEKFEKRWDDELQEWRYIDVVRVDAGTARRLGVPDGSLVCASVLDSGDITAIVTAANGVMHADGPDAKRIKLER